MASNESQVQNAICEYLEARRHCFFRLNNIPAFNRGAGGKITMRKLPKYTPKGLPDIVVIRFGRFIGLEVKDKGYQSKDQKLMQEWIESAGARYHVVRSIDDVQELGL
tara:strand:- start:2821 stop:3144 length:324 start_codon:yes stop_codon:yes gene_type:complete